MTESEQNYEKIRKILSPKLTAELPKNELTDKLLRAIFTEEEANVIAKGIKRGLKPTSLRKIKKRSGVSKKDGKEMLIEMEKKGKILKIGPFWVMPSYVPGLFEMYFTASRDDPESLKKAGEAHYALVESGFHVDHMKKKYPFARVIPSAEPVEKSIEIGKKLKVEHNILPFEVLKKYLSKHKTFAVHRCACRTAAELAGNPCKLTDENYCVTIGFVAKEVIREGLGRQVNLEELLEIIKEAEKKGLVHQAMNIKKSIAYICQCCPCCCSILKPVHDLRDKNIMGVTNFIPQIDQEVCTECGTCIKKCPMETISKLDNNKIEINLDACIGCGVCASNCPQGAISLKKVKNTKPVKGFLGLYRKFKKKK